jgi:predicted amidohydrolase YtcJ
MFRSGVFFLYFVGLCGLLAAQKAELILHNGKIVTVDRDFSIRQAVAVRAGRIVAVGTDQTVLTERGPKTRVIDLRGRTVLPGLFDNHVHAYSAGLSEFRKPLPVIHSIDDLQRYIREQALHVPKGQWIIVPLPFPSRLREMRMPTRELLDVAPEHPVLLDHPFITVANTLALKLSGIDAKTPEPPGGKIVRDEAGKPTGVLRNARSLLTNPPLPARAQYSSEDLTEEERLQALEGMLKKYMAAGLTSIKDREATPQDEIPRYEKLRVLNRLPIRVTLTWRLDTSRPTEELVREIRSAPYRPGAGDEWLKFGTFKVIADGGMLLGTAYQRQPYGAFGKQLYAQTDPDNRGQLFVPPEKLQAVMRAARERGWQLAAHTQGGGAIDALLDAFEAVDREAPIAPSRSHVIHASFQSRQAIARMKRMGVLADAQAAWLYCDSAALQKVFTYDGMRYFFPLRSYLNAGILVAGGSDHMFGHDKNKAVNPYNPFLGMYVSVTRKNAHGQLIYPEEKVSREEALKMYTIWGAHMEFAEKSKGSIEPGKLADMVVIDRDYLTCAEDEIRHIEPLMTIVDGRVAYQR